MTNETVNSVPVHYHKLPIISGQDTIYPEGLPLWDPINRRIVIGDGVTEGGLTILRQGDDSSYIRKEVTANKAAVTTDWLICENDCTVSLPATDNTTQYVKVSCVGDYTINVVTNNNLPVCTLVDKTTIEFINFSGGDWHQVITSSIQETESTVSIDYVMLVRPASEASLYPKIEASTSANFLSPIAIDPYTSSTDRNLLKLYNGTDWLPFPNTGGLGSTYDNVDISVNIDKFSRLEQPYYIRYCWVDSEGTESNYRAMMFPSNTLTTAVATEAEESELSDMLMLTRPVSDLELYPKVVASSQPDFTDAQTIDPYSEDTDREAIMMFNGIDWVAFPETGGLGSVYDTETVIVDMKYITVAKPYYAKYCWVSGDGVDSNYKAFIYPSVSAPEPMTQNSYLESSSSSGIAES